MKISDSDLRTPDKFPPTAYRFSQPCRRLPGFDQKPPGLQTDRKRTSQSASLLAHERSRFAICVQKILCRSTVVFIFYARNFFCISRTISFLLNRNSHTSIRKLTHMQISDGYSTVTTPATNRITGITPPKAPASRR